jgi:hypothetical protein
MSYVIYVIKSTRLVSRKPYKTLAAAKSAITRGERNGTIDRDLVAIASTTDFYGRIEGMVERTNLLSGQKYMEAVNTPSYCSPSSEAYWSM